MTENAIVAFNGAIIEYWAASHAALVESYEADSDAHADLVLTTIQRVRDAADAVLGFRYESFDNETS